MSTEVEMPGFALKPGFEVLHFIEVRIEELGPRATLVCNAAKGAPCRRRPADTSVEEWSDDYAGEMVDDECFAVGWLEASEWEGVDVLPRDGKVSRAPVGVGYNGYGLELNILPATVLAPLSVTSEQVEAGIAEFVEVWNEGMQADYPEGVYPSEHECMAAGFAAALAAMGIPVVDGE